MDLKKRQDNTTYWVFILKQKGTECSLQKGKVPGSAQAGEVTAVMTGLLELDKRKSKRAKVIPYSFTAFRLSR